MSDYDKIINIEHFEPKNHKRMDKYSRAAQFSSFAALTGFGDDVKETARKTHDKAELEEYELSVLNEKINKIIEMQKSHPEITVTYFKKDAKKQGGAYITEKITVRFVDKINRLIETAEKKKIMIDDIVEIE